MRDRDGPGDDAQNAQDPGGDTPGGDRRADGQGQGHGQEREQAEGQAGAWDEVEFDEAFIRGAEVSEPAARTRMLRDRWRDRPPEPQPWRADEPPAGWFFSKARKARRRTRRKRRRDDS